MRRVLLSCAEGRGKINTNTSIIDNKNGIRTKDLPYTLVKVLTQAYSLES